MANGDPEFENDPRERQKLEQFFAPIAPLLEEFAARHNLRVHKYHRLNASWDFRFRHPAGGDVNFQVLWSGPDAVLLVVAHWQLCDYTKFRRSAWSSDRRWLPRDDPQLGSVLLGLLREIVALPVEVLVPDGRDYESLWRRNIDGRVAHGAALPLPVL